MSYVNYAEIEVGDRVRVEQYLTGRLYPNPHPDHKVIGQIGIVVKKARQIRSYGDGPVMLYVRLPNTHSPSEAVIRTFSASESHYELVSLVSKGNGQARPGIEYQLSESELRQDRWLSYLKKLDLEHRDFSHQGWSNAATWMANQYLTNEPGAMRQIPAMIRKDGTINPNKIEKLFKSTRLKLDSWVFEPPIEPPSEFAGWRIPGLASRTAVNWQEIADDLAQSHKERAA